MDAVVLEQVLGYIHNWFVRDSIDVNNCEVVDGHLPASIPIPNGVWYRIKGSYLNDGMHLKGDQNEGLVDETFDGTITTHVIPRALLVVVQEVSDWVTKYGGSADSPYQSESFGGYTYSKGSRYNSSSQSGDSGWQAAFAGRFRQWRKLA